MAAKKKVPVTKAVKKVVKKVTAPTIATPEPPTLIVPFEPEPIPEPAPPIYPSVPPSWRKQRGNAVWHGNPQCAEWPTSDYSERFQRPSESHCEEAPCP